jgi:hypothetical protein
VSHCFISLQKNGTTIIFRDAWDEKRLPLKEETYKPISVDVAFNKGFVKNALNAGVCLRKCSCQKRELPVTFDFNGNETYFGETLERVMKQQGTLSQMLM